jgi:hypothetical protein
VEASDFHLYNCCRILLFEEKRCSVWR